MKRTTLIAPQPNEYLKEEIISIVQDPDFDPRVRMRAAIVLMSSYGKTDEAIAKEFGSSKDMVKTWIGRFILAEDDLNKISEEQDERQTRKALIEVLSDKRRTGAPKKFSDEVVKAIKELARHEPENYGHKSSRWTYQMLAKTAVDEGIVDKISMSSICRIFKKPNVDPQIFNENIFI